MLFGPAIGGVYSMLIELDNTGGASAPPNRVSGAQVRVTEPESVEDAVIVSETKTRARSE